MTHEKNNVMKISIIFLLLAHLTDALTVPGPGGRYGGDEGRDAA